jgi:hypothetical protein
MAIILLMGILILTEALGGSGRFCYGLRGEYLESYVCGATRPMFSVSGTKIWKVKNV